MTESKKIRVAMIGAGNMSNKVHYPSLASFDDVEIAAICDIDTGRLHTTADRYGVEKRYLDYQKMVDEIAPDAVYAIGQPHIFYDIWMWCLAQGQNLYIEKPMAITIHQARALAHMAEKNGCITQVSFQRRSCPMVVKLRDACLERGPIVHAVCRFYKCAFDPYLEARDHMMDDGVHAIDTLRWMCGGEVVDIHSITKRVTTLDSQTGQTSCATDAKLAQAVRRTMPPRWHRSIPVSRAIPTCIPNRVMRSRACRAVA